MPGSGVGLAPGDTWTVRELLDALIARSGNEAAEMLAVHVAGDTPAFLSMMRADAVAMGLAEPPLVSVSGLDDDNRFSARDLATIARVALDESELRPILGARQVTLPGEGTVETRNELLLSYPDATGVKTGFTSLAGNSLIGSAQRDGRELVAVVLGAGEDPARFDAAAELLDLGFEAFAATTLGAETGYAVAGGEVVVRVDALEVLAPTQATAQLRLPLAARAPDQAPSVSVEVDGTPLGTADAEVDRAGVGAPVESDAAIGRAAVDGVWAALRAATAQDGLG